MNISVAPGAFQLSEPPMLFVVWESGIGKSYCLGGGGLNFYYTRIAEAKCIWEHVILEEGMGLSIYNLNAKSIYLGGGRMKEWNIGGGHFTPGYYSSGWGPFLVLAPGLQPGWTRASKHAW